MFESPSIGMIFVECNGADENRTGTDEVHCLNQTNSGFSAQGTFQQYLCAGRSYI